MENASEVLSCLSPFFESLVNIFGLQLCASLLVSGSALRLVWLCASSSEFMISWIVTGDICSEENAVTGLNPVGALLLIFPIPDSSIWIEPNVMKLVSMAHNSAVAKVVHLRYRHSVCCR